MSCKDESRPANVPVPDKQMITVLIKTESHFSIDRTRVRKLIEMILTEKGVKAPVEVSLSIIGDRMMKKLNRTYRKLDETTNVLSFPLAVNHNKERFIDPPQQIIYLGDIVISYPQAINDAVRDNKLVDDKIDELVEHGLFHLLGIHHE